MPSPAITARASGSASGARLPRNSGTTCRPGKRRRLREAARALHGQTGEHRRQRFAGACGAASALRALQRMHRQQVLDGRAGHRLAAFVEPRIRHHRREIGSPDAGHEDRLARRRHRAGRGAEDIGEAATRDRPRRPTVPMPPACASMTPAATGVPARRPSSRRGVCRQTGAERRARVDDALADARRSLRRPARRGRWCGSSSSSQRCSCAR